MNKPFILESDRIELSRGARWKLVIFGIIAALLLCAIFEGGLRVYVHRKAARERGRALPTLAERKAYQHPDSLLGWALTPGYNAHGIRVNALGFRGPEITVPKPPGTSRIVAIGDSTTFGLNGEECPYTAQLQGLLRAGRPERRFQVVNAGVEGYSSVHALRLLERRIGPLQPDIVILYIGWNDLYGTNPFIAQVPSLQEDLQEARPLTWPGTATSGRRVVDHLYILQFARHLTYLDLPRLRARFASASRPGVEIHPSMTRRYSNRLTRLVLRTREMGATPVLVTLPSVLSANMSADALRIVHYPQWARSDYRLFLRVIEEFNRTIWDIGRNEGAYLVDAAVVFDRLGGRKEQLFFDALHVHCEGHGLLARTFRDELARQGLTP